MAAAPRGVTVFTLGAVTPRAIEHLGAHFLPVEVLPLELPPDASLAASQPALRAAVNRAAHDWILILREGETVTPAGAAGMRAAVPDPPTAWGFRLKIQPSCGGKPLRLDSQPRFALAFRGNAIVGDKRLHLRLQSLSIQTAYHRLQFV